MLAIDQLLARGARRLRVLPGARHPIAFMQRRFARLLRADGWTVLRDFDGDLVLRVDRASHMGSTIYWHGYYGRNELAVLDRILAPHMVFIDVGAHIGQFTLFAGKRLSRGSVIAIEPVPAVFETLRWNVAANRFAQVKTLQIAIGESSGSAVMYDGVPSDDRYAHEAVATRYPALGRFHEIGVSEMWTLDDVIEREGLQAVHVIKLDIEGGELDALMGAKGCLAEHRPTLILEASAKLLHAAGRTLEELFSFLEAHRYRSFWIGDYSLTDAFRERRLRRFGRLVPVEDGAVADGNLLCVPRG